jgi:Holliday junction resolvasome RuvABC DNA-binding subunit
MSMTEQTTPAVERPPRQSHLDRGRFTVGEIQTMGRYVGIGPLALRQLVELASHVASIPRKKLPAGSRMSTPDPRGIAAAVIESQRVEAQLAALGYDRLAIVRVQQEIADLYTTTTISWKEATKRVLRGELG